MKEQWSDIRIVVKEHNPPESLFVLPKSKMTWNMNIWHFLFLPTQSEEQKQWSDGNVVHGDNEQGSFPIYRRDSHLPKWCKKQNWRSEYEAPIYGMFAIGDALDKIDWETQNRSLNIMVNRLMNNRLRCSGMGMGKSPM